MNQKSVKQGAREEWVELIRTIQSVTEDVVFGDEHVDSEAARIEGLRYVTRLLAAGAMAEIEFADPAYPAFTRLFTIPLNWGIPNPDTIYDYATIDGAFTYRITGQLGTAVAYEFEVHAGAIGDVANGRTVSAIGDIQSTDGSFELILSRDRQPGNWLELPEGHGFVVVRQNFNDWDAEEAIRMEIERIGATYPAPPLDVERLGARLQRLTNHHRQVGSVGKAIAGRYHAVPEDQVVFSEGFEGAQKQDIGLARQWYGFGHFQCDDDEAVILEVTPPECIYWNFHLGTLFWETVEWDIRQSSLNGHQAMLDDDGRFRAVISHHDPGVPNWLDPAGRRTGLICGRYLRSKSGPTASVRRVPLSNVRDHLPMSTPTITRAERDTALRRRVKGFRRLHGFR